MKLLDFRDFNQILGIMQMLSSESGQSQYLKEQYDTYLNLPSDDREKLSADMKKKVLPVVLKLSKILTEE